MNIDHFSPETITKLDHYVYRLIDPRNGNTFYVGVGQGNRIFDHIKGVIQYKGEEDFLSLKMENIQEIIKANMQVIHIIQRYGMSKDTALEVEAALIDTFPGLTNLVRGHHSMDRGITSAYEIEQETKLPVYEKPKNLNYMIIKTKAWEDMDWGGDKDKAIYEATKGNWIVSLDTVKDYPYVLSVYKSVVVAVYEVDHWYPCPDSNRKYFTGKRAKKEIEAIFLNKRIPDRFTVKGMSNPILYSKSDSNK